MGFNQLGEFPNQTELDIVFEAHLSAVENPMPVAYTFEFPEEMM
jgi:hypothetical protein